MSRSFSRVLLQTLSKIDAMISPEFPLYGCRVLKFDVTQERHGNGSHAERGSQGDFINHGVHHQ